MSSDIFFWKSFYRLQKNIPNIETTSKNEIGNINQNVVLTVLLL